MLGSSASQRASMGDERGSANESENLAATAASPRLLPCCRNPSVQLPRPVSLPPRPSGAPLAARASARHAAPAPGAQPAATALSRANNRHRRRARRASRSAATAEHAPARAERAPTRAEHAPARVDSRNAASGRAHQFPPRRRTSAGALGGADEHAQRADRDQRPSFAK